MGCEVEIPAESIAVAWWKHLKILVFCRFLKALKNWLGGRDLNPDTVVQSHVSYRWTTSHRERALIIEEEPGSVKPITASS
jgi:hypothetical protein